MQDLLGTRHCDRRDLAAELFPRLVGLLLDLGARRGELTLALALALFLALGDELVGPCVRLIHDLLGPLTGLTHELVDLRFGRLETLLTALRRRETVGDGLLALLDGVQEVRPDELHAKPHEERER